MTAPDRRYPLHERKGRTLKVVVAFDHTRDITLDMVEGAAVTATRALHDRRSLQEAWITNGQGMAKFSLWEGRGDYNICIDDVTKPGQLYDPTLDREACPTFTVW